MPNLGCVVDSDGLARLCSGFHQGYEREREREQDETRGSDREGMNLMVIEEHQAGDLVFTQTYYLYILLEATSACVIVPIAKCHGRCILSSLIFYFECHVTVGYFT